MQEWQNQILEREGFNKNETTKNTNKMKAMTITFYQNKTTGKYISKLRKGNEVIQTKEYDTYERARLSYIAWQADGHIPSY
jgi:hypothetical protein